MIEENLDYPDHDDTKETMFMGTESTVRCRFQRNGPYRPRSRQGSLSRDSRFDNYRNQCQYSGPRRVDNHDRS